MDNNTLTHHGTKGMRWGVRRFQNKDGSLTPAGKKRYSEENPNNDSNKETLSTQSKKTVKNMTDDELRERIARLDLEKRYKELMKSTSPQKSTRGKDFVMDVLEKSGKNIATQLTTYAMGTAVNKAFGKALKDPSIVNPKKGQKEK